MPQFLFYFLYLKNFWIQNQRTRFTNLFQLLHAAPGMHNICKASWTAWMKWIYSPSILADLILSFQIVLKRDIRQWSLLQGLDWNSASLPYLALRENMLATAFFDGIQSATLYSSVLLCETGEGIIPQLLFAIHHTPRGTTNCLLILSTQWFE